jgi:hypothetical protein
MKKTLTILVLVLGLIGYSNVSAQSKLGAGLKAGINFATQTTEGSGAGVAVSQLLGFNAGAYCNFFILDFLAIQPELLISTRGSDWDDPSYDVKDLLTYIDLPVMVRYQPLKYLNIQAGPQFGYLVKASQKDDISGEVSDINEWYDAIDIGLAFGAELNLPFKVNITARYVLGLIPVTNDVEYIEPWKNNFFQLSVGFRLIGN